MVESFANKFKRIFFNFAKQNQKFHLVGHKIILSFPFGRTMEYAYTIWVEMKHTRKRVEC